MSEQSKILTLKDFDFEVPEELVAQQPLSRRDDARLLIYKPGHAPTQSQVKRLSDEVPDGTLFILNDSRVIASRIHGKIPTGARIEILLIEPVIKDGVEYWRCLGKPMKKLSKGVVITFDGTLSVRVVEDPAHSDAGPQPFLIEPSLRGAELLGWLDKNGEMPLPPYIDRKTPSPENRDLDKERYQNVYARGEGSVAAPTAGLHFTDDVMAALKRKNCIFKSVTLHVGAGTFLPVKARDPAMHIMHEERFMVPRETIDAVRRAQADGRPVVVVGTTAFRSLEGLGFAARQAGKSPEDLSDQWHRTGIFIRPTRETDRFKSWCADALMTNFHQPESTLFMLICALIGYDSARHLYTHAVAEKFRFFSYGDSSLLWLTE